MTENQKIAALEYRLANAIMSRDRYYGEWKQAATEIELHQKQTARRANELAECRMQNIKLQEQIGELKTEIKERDRQIAALVKEANK